MRRDPKAGSDLGSWPVRKRSVKLHGHTTSVSLEDEFWAELKRIAAETGVPLAHLIERIDADRGGTNLSAALRLTVLADLRSKLAASRGP